MGKIAASGVDVETEKEDVCFLSTMLMAVGQTLADLDQSAEDQSPAPKKSKLS
jgi:hypothetical protein